jgi:hypothetical protein
MPASPRLALFATKLARRSSGSGNGNGSGNVGGGEVGGRSNDGTSAAMAAALANASAAPRSPVPSSASNDNVAGAVASQKNSRSPLRSTLLAATYPVGLLLSPQKSSSNSNNDGTPTSRTPNLRRMRRNQDALARSAPALGGVAVLDENELLTADRNYRRVIRRFREGDHVLVSCHNYPSSLSGAARFGFASSLVNQHGYPPHHGESLPERSGPYKYVLAQVKELHFEEIVTYYTVTRCDTHQEQRADAEFMEPIRTPQGLQAAMAAAAASSSSTASSSALSSNAMAGGGGRRTSGLAARGVDAPYPSRSMSGGGGLGRGTSLTFRAVGSGGAGQGGNAYSQSDSFSVKQNGAHAVPSFRERCWEVMCCGCCRPLGCSVACRNASRVAFRAACWLPTAAYDVVVTKCVAKCLGPVVSRLLAATRKQAGLVLNGVDPYRCRIRVTAVNFVVLCSIWYMFVDMARLAFFPPSTDDAIAIVNLSVWAILLVELLLEVFIRPDGYSLLIVSEKAFAPTTERYISAFHLAVEFLSLLVFIPEFYCVFSPAVTCGERLPFSYINSALLGVIGPTRADVFYGQAYAALIRLRIFGLVRHWKNMWVANTFINQKWKGKDPGLLSSIVPYSKLTRSVSQRHKKRHQLLLSVEQPDDHRKESGTALSETVKAPVDPEVVEQRKRENALTNASTIGTALMVTNSYRALAILWIIVGLFPIVATFLDQYTNPIAYEMTRQMQATNLVASDTNLSTCEYLRDSMWAWLTAIQQPGSGESNAPYLLTLDILPTRCPFQRFGNQTAGVYCQTFMGSSSTSPQVRPAYASNYSDEIIQSMCQLWELTAAAQSTQGIADAVGTRVGALLFYNESEVWNLTNVTSGGAAMSTFSIAVNFDATSIVSSV